MLSIYELLSGSEIWVSQLVVSETLWQWLRPSRESRWLSSINSLSLSLLHDFTLLIDPDISASSPDLAAHDDFHGLNFNVHFLWILSIFDATTRHFHNTGTQSPGIPSSTVTWACQSQWSNKQQPAGESKKTCTTACDICKLNEAPLRHVQGIVQVPAPKSCNAM